MDEPDSSRLRGRYAPSGKEADFEPGSRGRVLRNLRGIRSIREMQAAESAALLTATELWIGRARATQRFTAADLRAMHASWLGEIYPWAGEYRQVDLTKGDFRFANARQIERLMGALERGPLAAFTPCRAGSVEHVARALGVVHAELVLVHPFREGNGRVARLLATLMGLQAGFPALRFGALDGRNRALYFAAIRAAVGEDYGPISGLFAAAIARTKRAAARSAADPRQPGR